MRAKSRVENNTIIANEREEICDPFTGGGACDAIINIQYPL